MEQAGNKQKIKLLLLMDMLRAETDGSHCLTTAQICRRLGEKGISCERRTVTMDIDLLCEYGYPIGRKMVGHQKGYFLTERTFSLPELRLLSDAVQASHFITAEKSAELVEKITTLAAAHDTGDLRGTLHGTGKPKSFNEKCFEITGILHEAIRQGRKISFFYFDYNSRRRHVLKNDGRPYTVSPYDLICDSDFYYLTGWCDERREVRVFRVDRIEKKPVILADPSRKPPRGYRVEKYTQEVFRMYAAQKPVTVTLLCEEPMMKALVDQFGTRARTQPLEDGRFRAKVRVYASPTFYRWLFGWGGMMKIEGPEEVVEEYREKLIEEINSYIRSD